MWINFTATGLHHVHPTWAGTFVLAALVAMFPGINFVVLDSDCLPVTLFEAEDLWTEVTWHDIQHIWKVAFQRLTH